MKKIIFLLFTLSGTLYSQDRPRILFSASDIPNIRQRVNSGPQIARDSWQELLANCNYYQTNLPDCANTRWTSFVVGKLAFAHIIDPGDPNGYGQRAVYLALNHLVPMNSSSCGHWPYVRKAIGLAYVNDYCQDIMDQNTKNTIELGLYDAILWLRNWANTGSSLNANNWCSFYGSALGIGAISLDGSAVVPGGYDASDDINLATNVILGEFDGLYDSTGAPYESVFYGFQPLVGVLPFAEALKRRNDGNSIIFNLQAMKNLSKWYSYEILPNIIRNGFLQGSHQYNNNLTAAYYWTNAWLFLQLVNEYQDGLALYVFNQTFQNMSVSRFNEVLSAPGLQFRHGFTWDTDLIMPIIKFNPIQEISPQTILPKTHYFKERGLVYFRSGWNSIDDVQLAFESRFAKKPNSRYYHWHHSDRDKNNFTINIYGEKFAVDAGGQYYRTQNHNCIIIDGKGQACNPYLNGDPNQNDNHPGWNGQGSIVDFFDNDFIGFVKGDAKDAYDSLYVEINHPVTPTYRKTGDPNELNHLGYLNPVQIADRYMMYIKLNDNIPPYFIVADDIQKDVNTHQFSFNYHTPSGFSSTQINPSTLRLYKTATPSKYMDLTMISSIQDYNTTSQTITIEPSIDEGFGYIESGPKELFQTVITKNAVNPYYHIILYPHKSGVLEPQSYVNLASTGGTCGKISWLSSQPIDDYSCFKHSNNSQGYLNNSSINTNAKFSFIRHNIQTGKVIKYFINNGNSLTFDGFDILNSYGSNVNASYSGDKVEVTGNAITHIKIYAPVANTLIVNNQSVSFGRINDYIYYPYAEVNSSLSENQTWSGEILITDDISTNEYNLTINPGAKVYFNNDKTLTINGHFNSVGTLDLPILYSGLITSDYIMGGVIITNGALVNIDYSHFKNGSTGLFLTDFDGKESIFNHLLFENNVTGMYVSKSIAGIDNSNFIFNQTGLISQASELYLNYSNLSYNDNEGLYLFDNRSYTISNNHFNNNGSKGVYFKYSSDGQFNSNIVSNNGNASGTELKGGLVFYQSSPILKSNQIIENYGPGILSLSSSFPIMNSKSQNLISNNHKISFSDPSENNAEILVKDISFPVIDYGHNDILDVEGGYLIYGDEDPRLNFLHVRNNYWGTTEIKDIESRLYRGGGFIFTPFDETSNVQQNSEEPVELLFTRAYQSELDSNFALAELRYDSLIVLYPSCVHAKASLDRIFYTKRKSGKDISAIRSYFINLINNSDEGISHIAKRMSIRCLMANDDYITAMSEYENWSQITAFLCDSLYSIVDIMSNELLNTNGRIGKSISSNSEKIRGNIKTFRDYNIKSDIPLNDLFNKNKKTTINSKPNKFDISQNYPNPFNPTTTIKYQLPNKCKTSIIIYNILGQKVKTLIDQNQEVGAYSVIWDGKNSNGVCVSNGIYIYRIIATTKDNVYMNSKKMILIK